MFSMECIVVVHLATTERQSTLPDSLIKITISWLSLQEIAVLKSKTEVRALTNFLRNDFSIIDQLGVA